MMKKETHTISFRVDAHHFAKLNEEALKHGVSVHEEARRVVIDCLDHKETEAVLEKLSAIQRDAAKIGDVEKSVADLRSDLAEAVEWIVKKLQRN